MNEATPKLRKTRHMLLTVADQVVTAYNNGCTIAEIADFFDCANGTVRNLLIIKNVTRRPQGRKKSRVQAPIDEINEEI
jgi:hypothetical protein